MFDIAPYFRKVISEMPVCSLVSMGENLEESGNNSKAIKKVIIDLSLELLRRKWGCS